MQRVESLVRRVRLLSLRVRVKGPELIVFGQMEKGLFIPELQQSLHWTVHKLLLANNTDYLQTDVISGLCFGCSEAPAEVLHLSSSYLSISKHSSPYREMRTSTSLARL